MTPAETALLPCPFCGNAAIIDDGGRIKYLAYVGCEECNVYFGAGTNNLHQAITTWNRRASPHPSAEQVQDKKDAERYRWLRDDRNEKARILSQYAGCTLDEKIDADLDLSKIAAPQNETSQGSRLTIRSAGVVADSSAGAAPHIASDDARGISQRDVPCRTHLMINCERCFPSAPQPSPD